MPARIRRAIRCAALLFALPAALFAPPSRAAEPPAPARPSRLQGTAIFERNRPVTGATIVIFPEYPSGEIVISTTDAKGNFRIDNVPDGAYTVSFERAGLATLRKEHVELKAPFRPTVEVVMKAAPQGPPAAPATSAGDLSLTGRATDREGAPVSDLTIRLTREGADTDPIERRTGENGEFSATGLAEGNWLLEAKGLAYLTVRATVPLTPTAPRIRLVLVPQPPAFDPIPIDLLPPEEPIPPPEAPAVPPPATNPSGGSVGQ